MEEFYRGKKIGKSEKKNLEKISRLFSPNFFHFFSFHFWIQIFSSKKLFFSEIFSRFFYYSALWGRAQQAVGCVGERSEPPAGGLAVGAEGSFNSEFV